MSINAIKLYIAGPMSGLPDFNKAEFARNTDRLRGSGFRVTNPAELFTHTDKPWEFYMRHALKAMLDCDAIFMLVGWSSSRGANVELDLAKELGMGVMFETDFFPKIERP